MKEKRYRRKNFEIVFYEGLVKKVPGFFQALSCLGDAYTRKGFYEEGLEIDRRLVRLRPEDPCVHYNLACSLSLLGNVEESLEELETAVKLGYDDFAYMFRDPDLETVRNASLFAGFLKTVENNGNTGMRYQC